MVGGDQLDGSLQQFFGVRYADQLRQRVGDLQKEAPGMDQDLMKLQHEVKSLIEQVTEANIKQKG